MPEPVQQWANLIKKSALNISAECTWTIQRPLVIREKTDIKTLDCKVPQSKYIKKISNIDFFFPYVRSSRGYLGITAFRHILQDPRTQNIPLILETPSFEQPKEVWGKEIGILHTLTDDSETNSKYEEDLEELRSVVKEAELKNGKGKESGEKKYKYKTAKVRWYKIMSYICLVC